MSVVLGPGMDRQPDHWGFGEFLAGRRMDQWVPCQGELVSRPSGWRHRLVAGHLQEDGSTLGLGEMMIRR